MFIPAFAYLAYSCALAHLTPPPPAAPSRRFSLKVVQKKKKEIACLIFFKCSLISPLSLSIVVPLSLVFFFLSYLIIFPLFLFFFFFLPSSLPALFFASFLPHIYINQTTPTTLV